MDATATTRKRRRRLEPALDRRFDAVLFDWEGTGVADQADATALRDAIEQLCELSLVLGLIATADVGDVDGRLDTRPRGPGRLYLCTGRGSEVSIVDSEGVRVVHERRATAAEKA